MINTKNIYGVVFKGIIFLGLLFFVINAIGFLFSEKETSVWDGFYKQESNTANLLFLGNSHLNLGIDLDIVDSKINSKSLALGTKGQNIYQTYYNVQEAYKYQVPDILIIENFLFYERLTKEEFINQDPSINDYKKRYLSFEGKKIGMTKYQEGKEFFEGSIVENLFVGIKKHSNWNDIETIKARLENRGVDKVNKIGASRSVLSSKRAEKYKTKQKFNLQNFNIMPDEQKSLDDIIALAKEKGTKHILLLTIPFYKEYREKVNYKSLDLPLKEYVSKTKNVSYLDLNTVFPDWDNTYFSNDNVGYNQHLNYKGAIKTSTYLADFINTNYNFEFKKTNAVLPEYYLYNTILKDTLITGNRILGNLERINGLNKPQFSIQQGKVMTLRGWMAIENRDSKDNMMYVALEKDGNFIYLNNNKQLEREERKDVSKYFKKDYIYDNSGFKIKVNTNLLEKGKYKTYLVIKNEEGEILLTRARKEIEIL